MRILIFSDTHGYIEDCIALIGNIQKTDMVLHAGDYTEDAEKLAAMYPRLPLYYVKGNGDFFTSAPNEQLIHADGKRIYLTHGHLQSVKSDKEYETLVGQAKELNADLAVFGHTHQPYEGFFGNLTLLNPGSLRYTGTYGVCEIEDGKLKTCICSVR